MKILLNFGKQEYIPNQNNTTSLPDDFTGKAIAKVEYGVFHFTTNIDYTVYFRYSQNWSIDFWLCLDLSKYSIPFEVEREIYNMIDSRIRKQYGIEEEGV
jgi:hypothetical protein|nr:MAG TPA: hypothetical protein [Caudoviricetes sp.]